METMNYVLGYWWLIAIVLCLVFYKLILKLFGVIIVPEDKAGAVIKDWVLFGNNRNLPDGRIVAINGEAGYQADLLAPGIHWGYWPWQYSIHMQDVIIIPEGNLGYVEAKDGKIPDHGSILVPSVESDNFQNAKMFLTKDGFKGIQRNLLKPGTYRINPYLFKVAIEPFTNIPQGKVGIVTTLDGIPITAGQIAGEVIPGHKSFQDVEAFLSGGGKRGLQEEIVQSGNWMLHPKFVTIEQIDMTEIKVGYVGVVVSFVGEEGVDLSGTEFKHGNIVKKGQKGVWETTFDPGKYALNTKIMTVERVSTTNIVLNWATGRTESHNLDKELSTISLRSKDGFKFNADVSQIINIHYKEAPKVIARFGSVLNLVSQVLEPTIGNYFRNSAQSSTVLDFLAKREERQNEAKKHIKAVLDDYNVVAVDTLIGDINPPEELMKPLTEKQIAIQEQATFDEKKKTQDQRKEYESSKAIAEKQPEFIAAQISVKIATEKKQATVIDAEASKESAVLKADGEAQATTAIGNAKAEVTLKMGTAEATVAKEKVAAMGEGNYATVLVAEHLAKNNIKLVPEILVNGAGGEGGANGLITALLGAEFLKGNMTNVKKEVKEPVAAPVETKDNKTASSSAAGPKKDEQKK